jgi:hypothetical protein
MDASKLKEIQDAINDTIEGWVSGTVKDRFINRPVGVPKRSLWDKFKQGVANWFWGPTGDKHNPYRWRSRFGDELGVSESFDPSIFTLNEYMEIKGVVDSLELRLEKAEQSKEEEEFGKLRLMSLIRSAAEDLKGMLFQAIRRVVMEPATPQAPPPAGRETNPKANPTAGATSGRVTLPSSKTKARATQAGGAVKPKAGGASSATKKTRKRNSGTSVSAANAASASADSATPDSSAAPLEDEKVDNAALSSAAADKTDAPATSPDAPSNDDASQAGGGDEGELKAKNPELRGFFYAKDQQPVNFQKRIKRFLRTEKYKNYAGGLERFWRSLGEEVDNNGWDEDETRYEWAMNMVVGDKFLEEISKITGFAKGEVKKDMIDYLATLDS